MSFEVAVSRRLGEIAVAAEFASEARLTALCGPSGAGKTSILNMIAGLLRPDGGRIAVAGTVLFDAAAGIDLAPEARRAGYVFQEGRLFPHLRVRANLLYGARGQPVAAQGAALGLDEVAALLGIAHLLERRPATLSGGEARRVAIGRALLAAPRFLLLDEPMAGIDARRRGEIMALIERIRDALSVPILLVSHDAGEVERLAGRIVAIAAP